MLKIIFPGAEYFNEQEYMYVCSGYDWRAQFIHFFILLKLNSLKTQVYSKSI